MKIKELFLREITFTAIGAYYEDYISDLIKSGIKVKKVNNNKGILYIRINRNDYKKAASIARKNNTRIRIYKRHGINFKKIKIKRYYGVFAGIVFVSIIIVLLQNFIWTINIHGADEKTESLILKAIAEKGIIPGALIDNINVNSAELHTKLNVNNISWIKIEINGSRADVYLNEANPIEKQKLSRKTPCNIIAGKTGTIIDAQIYSGTFLYKKGSGVSEGKVIVSGIVNDGADNLLMTHADAKIIAEFNETITLRQDYKTTEKIINHNYSEEEKELMIFGFVIPITDKLKNPENMICEETINKCYLCGYELPWKIKINKYKKYDEKEITRTYEDVNKILEQKLEIHCINFYSDYEVIDIAKKTEYDENGITLTANVKLQGNIAIQQEILTNQN